MAVNSPVDTAGEVGPSADILPQVSYPVELYVELCTEPHYLRLLCSC